MTTGRWNDSNLASVSLVEEALVDRSFDRQVDMVVSAPEPDTFRVASPDGSVTFDRVESGDRYEYRILDRSGDDPLANQNTSHHNTLDDQRACGVPDRSSNAYPHAYDQIAQFFDAPHAPELVAQHTASHHFDENLGQHGSLGVAQARAPFIAGGAGIVGAGWQPASARMVDVAPTIAALLGLAPCPGAIGPTGRRRPEALLRRQDGDPMVDLVVSGEARHVVVVLLDGVNANVLYDGVRCGDAPTIAAIADRGTVLGNGLMASWPTATLANHTTANTGAHPGHTGILHHTWYDRGRDHTPDLLSMDEIFSTMVHLGDGVETIHQAIHRSRPDAFTLAAYEFCDTGADFSSFAAVRAGELPILAQPSDMVAPTMEFIETCGQYSFMSSVDELATNQAVDIWSQAQGNPLPTFTWLSLSLTDEAGHVAGPDAAMTRAAIRDSDARIARLVAAIDRAGVLDDTAFLVFADHGMELNDPENDASWADALAATGVPCRDVGDGLIYLH